MVLLHGGGTPLVSGNARWRGPGHNAVVQHGSTWLDVYHSYDALDAGIPTPANLRAGVARGLASIRGAVTDHARNEPVV